MLADVVPPCTLLTITATADVLIQAPVVKSEKPGVLFVVLHRARGLSIPKQRQDAFESQHPTTPHTFNDTNAQVSGKFTPYALIDFDKSQAFVGSVGGTLEEPSWAGTSTQYKFDVTRVTELNIHLYVRHPNAPRNSGHEHDICLGATSIHPRFKDEQPGHGKISSMSEQVQNGTYWVELQDGTGMLKISFEYVENPTTRLSIDDFELLKVLGQGAFGKVMQVQKKDTNRVYALKTVRKSKILSRPEITSPLVERSIHSRISHPFIIPLKFAFQSPEKLYFVLAFVNGGELLGHLRNEGRFDVGRSRFYIAELICALEYLHGIGIIYRDLKPENILLDYQGHIALCDFGLSKMEMRGDDRTTTVCGTAEFMAPEVCLGGAYNKTVDWWALGILLYEMLVGQPPFYNEDVQQLYREILTAPLRFPDGDVVPSPARDLITSLLNRVPEQRLGANGAAEIRSHIFFEGVNWKKLLQRRYEPGFKPSVVSLYSPPR